MPNNLLQQTHYIIFLNNKINIIITANTTKNFLKSNLKKIALRTSQFTPCENHTFDNAKFVLCFCCQY